MSLLGVNPSNLRISLIALSAWDLVSAHLEFIAEEDVDRSLLKKK
jgi:hypothetical protein